MRRGKRRPLKPVAFWTYEIIRDALVRRGYCVRRIKEGRDTIILASRPKGWTNEGRGSRSRDAAMIRLRNGRIVLPHLGEELWDT